MDSQPTTSFVIPDLFAITPFVGSFNPHYAKVAPESSAWINSFRILSDTKRAFFLQGGSEILCAHAYPYADEERFRGTCDFVNLLFILDEISDDQNSKDASGTGSTFYNTLGNPEYDDGSILCKITQEFRQRLLKHCGPLTYKRFLDYCKTYTGAVTVEAALRECGEVLGLQAYEKLRRENSGVRFCFTLAGYALGVDLPDEVFEHPAFMAMHLATTDMVCWSNDLYSYNMEQAMGHTGNNIITVLMTHKSLSLQEAANHVGEHWKTLINTYLDAKESLPSWGEKIDHDVARYAMAMESWVIGNLNWSFETLRYFGPARLDVRRTGVVHLYPRQVKENSGEDS
ncbi:terpenoid synthase [Cubamyces sp. BRFM 1775]|nr:terpenoid synthase [Cubamyces sp. BRFM 1775]